MSAYTQMTSQLSMANQQLFTYGTKVRPTVIYQNSLKTNVSPQIMSNGRVAVNPSMIGANTISNNHVKTLRQLNINMSA